jgi:BirA family biotin operon repressor/biotin-[acetyl-CoA-carboxylase] ligase
VAAWHHLASTPSTNDVARRLAEGGAEAGSVVIADRQTAGRGRLGRAWWSPPDGAILMSVILRPRASRERIPALTLEAGLAVAEVLIARGVDARLKWPNDVLVRGLKVAGILCELVDDTAGRSVVIVGIGLNTNVIAEGFPPELAGIATSVQAELGAPVDRDALARELVAAIVARARRFDLAGLDVDAANALSMTARARVRAADGREGEALGIAGSGALRVLWDRASAPEEVFAGEISVAPPR